jgi:hypothetical protein
MLHMHYLRVAVLMVLAVLVFAHRGAAQNCTVAGTTYTCHQGLPHTAEFDYAGLIAGDVFRLYVNNAQVGADVPATNGTVQVTFGATLPVGSYTVAVSAWRQSMEARSTPVTLVLVNAPPSAPGNLHIVEITMRGLDLARHVLWEHRFETQVTGQ